MSGIPSFVFNSKGLKIVSVIGLYSIPKFLASHQSEGILLRGILTVIYYFLFCIVAYTVFDKVMEPANYNDSVENEIRNASKIKDLETVINGNSKDLKKRDVISQIVTLWGLDTTVASEIEKIVNLVVADFITPWFTLSKKIAWVCVL